MKTVVMMVIILTVVIMTVIFISQKSTGAFLTMHKRDDYTSCDYIEKSSLNNTAHRSYVGILLQVRHTCLEQGTWISYS